MARKVLVIGLDCADPKIIFNQKSNQLPNLRKIISNGIYGELTSCHPPITIPAWLVMATGKDPGSLGLYGFRHRSGFSYNKGWIATSKSIKAKTIWDALGEAGKQICLIGVPPSYPPLPVNGNLVSCFITPAVDRVYTYPGSLQAEIEDLVGEYIFDLEFRTENRDEMLARLYEMTEKRFRVIDYLLKTKPWDFFMFVEIGVDRAHHAFWKYFDQEHPKYVPGNKYEKVIPAYYRFIDEKIGKLLESIDDNTIVLIVSDHGAKGMRGAFCINQWLIEEGYLVLKEKPKGIMNLDKIEVDWDKTKAWGWGGYYARIFLNVKSREPRGVIDPGDYETERDILADKLKKIKDPDGKVMSTLVYRPEELYLECRGDPPDLMVYFDDLFWRSAGTIGHNTLYLSENDTGPDDAVHNYQGVFILYDPKVKYGMKIKGANLLDINPTVSKLMNLPIISSVKGSPLVPDVINKDEIRNIRFEKIALDEMGINKKCISLDITDPVLSAKPIKIKSSDEPAFKPQLKDRPSLKNVDNYSNLINGMVIWLTGLSASGKSTIANALAEELKSQGHRVEILDGDEVRAYLSPDLGFSKEERELHNRRVIYISKLLSRNGVIVIVPLISPYRHIRELAREEINNFIEVWVKCSLNECIKRDPKGLYGKALLGEINDLTGLHDPYEEPISPEIIVDSEMMSISECVKQIIAYLFLF